MSDSNQVDLVDGDLKWSRSVDCDIIITPVWKMLEWRCPGLEYLQKLVNKRGCLQRFWATFGIWKDNSWTTEVKAHYWRLEKRPCRHVLTDFTIVWCSVIFRPVWPIFVHTYTHSPSSLAVEYDCHSCGSLWVFKWEKRPILRQHCSVGTGEWRW